MAKAVREPRKQAHLRAWQVSGSCAQGFDTASSLGISADSLREARPPQDQREAAGGAGSCKLRV